MKTYNWKEKRNKSAFLALENGTVYRGFSMGAPVTAERILTSARGTALALAARPEPPRLTMVFGGAGLTRELNDAGLATVTCSDDGLAQGPDLPGTVLPFILRGVTLAGVNSVLESADRRDHAWARLAADLDPTLLESMTSTGPLVETPTIAAAILEGQVKGRVVVDVRA